MDNQSEQVARTPPPAARYEFDIDLDSESTHARVVRLIGADRRVLELGPATGYMSEVLQRRGCSVVGIEVDPEMASQAAQYCERVIVGDLESLDLEAELGSDRFDVIVAADVLEHLKDPLAALLRLRRFLSDEGFFVMSLPNVAHGSVRLALLEGRFPYQQSGLLDRTHLRFFTRETIGTLLDDAGLAAAEIYHQHLNIDASEVQFDHDAVPGELLAKLGSDPDAQTYQFVIKALPIEAPGVREMQRRIRELAHENARLREAQPQVRKLQETVAGLASREGQLRSALIDAHDQLLRRDEEIRRLQAERASRRLVPERILTSRIGRAYLKLRRIARRLMAA
jgi:O-antigen biosynthesis protein